MLHAIDERALIEGCIWVELGAGRNVAYDLQKLPQAHHASIGLARPHSLRYRRQLLSLSSICVSFVNRQEREQFPITQEGRLQFLDFGGWIVCVHHPGLHEVGQRELLPSHIELKLEFLGIYAATIDSSNVAHRGDCKRSIKRG